MFQSLEGLPILCQGLKSQLHIQALCIFTAFSLFFVGLHGPLFSFEALSIPLKQPIYLKPHFIHWQRHVI